MMKAALPAEGGKDMSTNFFLSFIPMEIPTVFDFLTYVI